MTITVKFEDDSEVVKAVRDYFNDYDLTDEEKMMNIEEFKEFMKNTTYEIFEDIPCDSVVDFTESQIKKAYEVYRDIVSPFYNTQNKLKDLEKKIANLLFEYIYTDDLESAMSDAEEFVSNYK